MKNAAANTPIPAPVPGNSPGFGKAANSGASSAGESPFADPNPPDFTWPWRKIFFLILLAVIVHVALICFFGTKKQIVPRPVSKVPRLQLAGDHDEFIALENPTLFALPNPRDFSSPLWLKIPVVMSPSFRWTELPKWLPLNTANPGATFQQFLTATTVPEIQLDVKPAPELTVQHISLGTALPQDSTLKIIGELAHRALLSPVPLPSLPYNNVIPPSEIQVLVDTSGHVISAILLPLTDGMEILERYDLADQRALDIATHLRFAPAPRLTFGEIIFKWHTVPVLDNTTSRP
jgi:hypothetical protein